MTKTTFVLRQAAIDDAGQVASLVSELLTELGGDRAEYKATRLKPVVAEMLDSDGRFAAILAFEAPLVSSGKVAAGVLTLSECLATYAHGCFGEIVELYVQPSQRSRGLGEPLIGAARDYGLERGWSILEVGAPAVPRWQRSVEFYKRCGFSEIGPRLDMRLS